MIPTRRLILAALLPAFVGMFAIVYRSVWIPLLALDLVLMVIAIGDAVLARGKLEVSREFGAVQSVGKPFKVTIAIRNVGSPALQLRFTEDLPGTAEGLPASVALPAAQTTRVTYPLRIDRRGEHPFGPITFRWASPLGFWERQTRMLIPGAAKVYPDFAQLRSYGIAARSDESRLPTRTRRRPGGENEFERLRPYVPGDPYRHVDWRATARRGEFVSREYGQEVNQNLILMVDAGRMMGAENGDLTSFDRALNAALMMGQVALRHGDRVGLLIFDRKVRVWLPPKGGARGGARLIRASYDVFPSFEEPDYALAFRHLSTHVRRRSLVVLFTSVIDEANADLAEALVKGLTSRHLPVCVWLRDSGIMELLEKTAEIDEDVYARGAAAEILGWRERSLTRLRQRGALVVDADPDRLTPALLANYLDIKARRLL